MKWDYLRSLSRQAEAGDGKQFVRAVREEIDTCMYYVL